MKTEEFEAIEKALDKFVITYAEANPEWLKLSLLTLIEDTIGLLKQYIEDPGTPDISWDYPSIELRYPVEINWEHFNFRDIIPDPLKYFTSPEDLEDPHKLSSLFANLFLEALPLVALKVLTRGFVRVIEEGEKSYMAILEPDLIGKPSYFQKLKKLPREEQEKKFNTLLKKIKPFKIDMSGAGTDPEGKEKSFKGRLLISIEPLVMNFEKKEAYYPVYMGLSFRGYHPTRWTEEERQGLWKTLLQEIITLIPEEKDFQLEPREETPQQQALPIIPQARATPILYIRAGLHIEKQKQGKKPTPAQASMFELLDIDDKKKAVEYGVEVAGIDITGPQTQALFAIQRLLSETNYKGNLEGKELKGEGSLKFRGYLPSLKFTPAQYLEAYGVKKYETSRGYLEFSGEERKDALGALRDLNDKRFFLAYERKYWKEGKELYDVITTIRPLIIITQGYEALTRLERDIVKTGADTQETNEKLKTIAIEPCPMLVDQIDSYFVLKPANYYQEIKLLVGHASKFVYRFIDFLSTEVTQREIASKGNTKNWMIERSTEALAYALRMNSWIERKQWKQIRGSLKKCYETAKGLGYLTSYELDIPGKTTTLDRLALNPDKFKRMKEIDEERKQLEQKATLPPS